MVKKYSFLFIIFAAILWSTDGLLRRSLYSLPPTVVVFYEHFLGFILLIPILLRNFTKIKLLSPKALLAFLWIALLSGVLGTLMYTTALGQVNYIKYSVVVLLVQMQPLFVVLFAHLILKEKITSAYIKWAILALGAAYLLSFPSLTINLQKNTGEIMAALLSIGAGFAWGSSTAFSRFTLLKLPVSVVTGIRFGLTVPLALIFVFLTKSHPALTQVSQPQWLALAAITLTTGMVSLLIYYKGLQFTEAKVSAIAELAWPLSAVFVGFYFLGERLTFTQIIGAGILLFSMYQVSKLQRYEAHKSNL